MFMFLLMFAVFGALLGYRLGTSRQRFVTMALVSITSI
jgi:hypothetical protein